MTAPLRIARAGDLDSWPERPRWLIRSIYPHPAVSIGAGQPKSFKTWLAIDAAVSVASATPCLGCFPVDLPGRALVYLAEDSLPDVRERLECVCNSRGLDLDRLDLHVITEPALRLDLVQDQERLRDAVEHLRPRLLVLDPLVRLHQLDENNSQEISRLLGYLRELQRSHDVSILLVHHASKRSRARQGQALRGSSDLHAWVDVGLYLTWRGQRLELAVELRAAASPDPLEVSLVQDDPRAVHLAVVSGAGSGAPPATLSLPQRALGLLREQASRVFRRYELREALGVNNARLGEALDELERRGFVRRTPGGWQAADGEEAT